MRKLWEDINRPSTLCNNICHDCKTISADQIFFQVHFRPRPYPKTELWTRNMNMVAAFETSPTKRKLHLVSLWWLRPCWDLQRLDGLLLRCNVYQVSSWGLQFAVATYQVLVWDMHIPHQKGQSETTIIYRSLMTVKRLFLGKSIMKQNYIRQELLLGTEWDDNVSSKNDVHLWSHRKWRLETSI